MKKIPVPYIKIVALKFSKETVNPSGAHEFSTGF
jgi:hypothetical protein